VNDEENEEEDAEEPGMDEEQGGSQSSKPAKSQLAGAEFRAEAFIVRHSSRADRENGNNGGYPDDPPLSKDGRELAKKAGTAMRTMAALPWAEVVYTSPFFRCLQTANEIAAELGGLAVRVEPGLSELCIEKIFEAQPVLRSPEEALEIALRRSEVDLSTPPELPALPAWPESGRGAKERVIKTARALLARHPGKAVCIVCHAHSLVEITRHLPKGGGVTVGANPGYCALSHIAPGGQLLLSQDRSYVRLAESAGPSAPYAAVDLTPAATAPAGCWTDGWNWSTCSESDDMAECDPSVEGLLGLDFDTVLERYPRFGKLVGGGSVEQKDQLRSDWAKQTAQVRKKLEEALARNLFAMS